jgi:hypothetical protein
MYENYDTPFCEGFCMMFAIFKVQYFYAYKYIVKKWQEDGGGKQWKAREENWRERSGAGNHLNFSPGWWIQPRLKVVFVSSNKTVGGIRTCV